MNPKFLLLSLILLWFGLGLNAQSRPFNADMVVALDGSGDFIKIQDAINAVTSNSERRTVIYIKRGVYNTEKLIIPGDKKNITFIGESRDETIISYHIYDCSGGLNNKCPAEDAAKWNSEIMRTSATLTIAGDGFRAENMTIRNTAGPVGQALAITVTADKCVFINVNLLGYQDTIYLWTAGKRSYFQNCLVVGRTDYIYGAGIAFFQGCEIRSWGGGWITAPATPQNQPYGFVFNQCEVSYATGSPRNGDDGATVALGRPWHEYPKVAWLRCNMTEKIDPKGWPTTWDMAYADTSIFLKLLEYQNTGAGANMSGRSTWVGLRAMTDLEAPDYTVQKVMGGSDGWDPTALPPVITTYTWNGNGATSGWRVPENWTPAGIPNIGEMAEVTIADTLTANGDSIKADLALYPKSAIEITANSYVTYLSLDSAEIVSSANAEFKGKIATKSANKISVGSNVLTMNATLNGVHSFTKEGNGKLLLGANNINYSGNWIVNAGSVEASAVNSLGKGNVTINSGGKLIILNDKAFQPKSTLSVVTGATVELSVSVFLSEFYIDGTMQPVGEYSAVSNPALISGTGKIIVGRPTVFTFVGGANGNWDIASYYVPALMPQTGDTVMVNREMETTGVTYPANIILQSTGKIRMRTTGVCNGWIEMQTGSKISYATSGAGFILNAPLRINGNITFEMSSSFATGNSLTLQGNIQGAGKATASNTRNIVCSATVILSGDNSGFSGIWDITKASTTAGSIAAMQGTSANSFGNGRIEVGNGNKVIFDHIQSIGLANDIVLLTGSKAVLNANVNAKTLTLAGTAYTNGIFNATSHPAFFEGTGSLTVGTTSINKLSASKSIIFYNRTLYFNSKVTSVKVYDLSGRCLINEKVSGASRSINLDNGIYIVKAKGNREYIQKIHVLN